MQREQQPHESGQPSGSERVDGGDQTARTLGWLSIGLGTAALAAPRTMSAITGMPSNAATTALQSLVGVRELATGIGLLNSPKEQQAGWHWARTAGDMMDLAVLGAAMAAPGANRGRLALTSAAVAGISAVDVAAAGQASLESSPETVTRSITINREPEDLYQFWREFNNLPRFMGHLQSIEVRDPTHSHWVVRAAGQTMEWDAEITEDRPNERIDWRTLPGSDIDVVGSVIFRPAPGNRGTEVVVHLRTSMPAGMVGKTVARIMGIAPSQQLADNLRRFKQVMETGEVIRSDARPSGETHEGMLMQPAAQPVSSQGLPVTARTGGNA